jgi:hypothetical protein
VPVLVPVLVLVLVLVRPLAPGPGRPHEVRRAARPADARRDLSARPRFARVLAQLSSGSIASPKGADGIGQLVLAFVEHALSVVDPYLDGLDRSSPHGPARHVGLWSARRLAHEVPYEGTR